MPEKHPHRPNKLAGTYDKYQSQTPRRFLPSRQPQPTPEIGANPSPGPSSRDGFSPARFLESPRFFAPPSTHTRQQASVPTTVNAEPQWSRSSSPFVSPWIRLEHPSSGRGPRCSRAWEDPILMENVTASNVSSPDSGPGASTANDPNTHTIGSLEIETESPDVNNDTEDQSGDNYRYPSDIAMGSDYNDHLENVGNIRHCRAGISSNLPKFTSQPKMQSTWPLPDNRARKRRRISISSARSSSVGSEGISSALTVAPSTYGEVRGEANETDIHYPGSSTGEDNKFEDDEHHRGFMSGPPGNAKSATCDDVDIRGRAPKAERGAIFLLRHPNMPVVGFPSLPSFKPDIDRTRSSREDPDMAVVATSPPRRAHTRYVAGGLAFSLQTWLGEANAENVREERANDPSLSDLAIISAKNSRAFTVSWCRRANPTLAEAASASGQLVRTILVRRNKENGGRSVFVDSCSAATLRRPFWRADISGDKWTVGSHWKAASGANT